MNISVIGLGVYSLAISKVLLKSNKVKMWTEDPKLAEEYKYSKKIKSINVAIPKGIKISNDIKEVLKDSDIIYIITASKYVDSVCNLMKDYYHKDVPICICSKGIEESREELLSEVVKHILNAKHIAVVSGPTFAIDILNDNPCALALASTSLKARNTVLETLASDNLKLRISKDIIGIQICGSIKNIIAIASGIIKGLGYSESTQSFLINESLHDIKEMIYYFGGKKRTILSFAGIGDLMLTCMSEKSRNFSFGYTIGKYQDKDKTKKYLLNNTVEGYNTLDVVYRLLKKKNIEIELINVIYDIVYNYNDPSILVKFLLNKK